MYLNALIDEDRSIVVPAKPAPVRRRATGRITENGEPRPARAAQPEERDAVLAARAVDGRRFLGVKWTKKR
jgi:hypothetical protein